MATIYEISEKYRFIQRMIESGVEESVFSEALMSVDGELSEKLEQYAMVIKNIESDIEGLDAEIERLKDRSQSMKNKIKRMKENMHNAMEVADTEKVKGVKFNFNLQNTKASVVILDENLVPQKFTEVKTSLQINKKDILEAVKNGEEVNGVELKRGKALYIR